MLHIWKDASQIDELENTQVLVLANAVIGSDGKVFNLQAGTGSLIYQVYKYTDVLVKLVPAEFSITGDQLTLVESLLSGEQLLIIPSKRLDMLFGGSTGEVITIQNRLWLKRDADFMYAAIRVYSEDILSASAIITQVNVQFVDGVSSEAFAGLVAGSLVGRALCFDGQFAGLITANTATSVMIDNATFTELVAKKVEIIAVSHLQFALDNAGIPGEFVPVLTLPDILDDTALVFWVKDSYSIPENAVNYPNNVIRVQSVEYIA